VSHASDRYKQHVLPLLAIDRAARGPGERILALLDDVLAAMEEDRAFMLLYARGSAVVPAKLRAAGRDPYVPYVGAFRNHLVETLEEARPDMTARQIEDLAVALTASLIALVTATVSDVPPRAVAEVAAPIRHLFGPALQVSTRPSTSTRE
jgi:hypothetical protein